MTDLVTESDEVKKQEPGSDTDTALSLSPLQALTGVLLRPYKAFTTMRDASRGHWWLVFLLAAIMTIVLVIVSSRVSFQQLEAVTMAGPDMPMSETDQSAVRGFQIVGLIFGAVFAVVGLLIGYLIRGGLVFGLGLALGGKGTFRQIFRMAVWTTLPDIIRNTLQSIVVLSTGMLPASGLSAILTAQEANQMPVLNTLLGAFDIYLLWSLILLAVGIAATSRMPRGKSFITALLYFVIAIAAQVGFAALGALLTSQMMPG